MSIHSDSVINQTLSRRRPLWVTLVICLGILLAPVLAAVLDGKFLEAFQQGYWRMLLLPAVIIVYVIVMGPIVSRNDEAVIQAFRPIINLDDTQYHNLIAQAGRINPVSEVIAVVLGALFGLWQSIYWIFNVPYFWLRLYQPVFLMVMYALLFWVVYGSFATTRLTAALHRQPLNINIFDIRPFEPIGRQSLALALVFVGGVTIGAIFGLNAQSLLIWQTWIIYIPMIAVPIAIFFLNMRGTQRVLSREKKRLLAELGPVILDLSREIRHSVANGQSLEALAAEYAGMTAYESRLRSARTWPYNTAMVRTLVFTILIPLLVRAVSVLLLEPR